MHRIPTYVIAVLLSVVLTILPSAFWPDLVMPIEDGREPRLLALEVRAYKVLVAPAAYAARAVTGWPTSYGSFFVAPYQETAGTPPLAMAIEHARWAFPIWLLTALAFAELSLGMLRRRRQRRTGKRGADAAVIAGAIFLLGCGAVEPPPRPSNVPAAAAWAGGADGGAWIACDLLTKEPYVTYACRTYTDAGHPWASGTYAFGRLVQNGNSRRFEPAGAFARVRSSDFESFNGTRIRLKDDRELVPHGEIRYPFGDGHGKKAVYALGREISPEVQY